MTDRRYDDDEIAAIFAKAAEGPPNAPLQAARHEGMTLAELQDIGREVGIAPDAVARAAQSLEVRRLVAPRTFLGMPMEVERTITLGRQLTEAEWEQLVVELRQVFQARGTVSSSGSFRQWTNGNLQALLEPTPSGHRLRLSTFKGGVRGLMALGAMSMVMSGGTAIASGIAGHLGDALPGVLAFALLGAGTMAIGAIRLPGWARLRGRQMDEIAARVALDAGPKMPDA